MSLLNRHADIGTLFFDVSSSNLYQNERLAREVYDTLILVKCCTYPKNDTVAAGVSTKAMDCEMYPNAVNVPQSAAVCLRLGLSWIKKGDRATEASAIRVDVAALAGRASFINRPKGKFVP